MASPAEVIKDLLVAASLGTFGASTGWNIVVGGFTDAPNTQISCIDSPGEPSNPKWLLDYPYVQVLVRGDKRAYAAAYQKVLDVRDVLLGLEPGDIDGDNWNGITQIGTPAFLRYDENDRPLFTSNYRIILEPAASALTNREPL